jgi:hypothetical protein
MVTAAGAVAEKLLAPPAVPAAAAGEPRAPPPAPMATTLTEVTPAGTGKLNVPVNVNARLPGDVVVVVNAEVKLLVPNEFVAYIATEYVVPVVKPFTKIK